MVVQNSFNNTLFYGVGGVKIQTTDNLAASGDLYYLNAARELIRVAIGSSGQVLISTGTALVWQTGAAPSGNAGGDLFGTYPSPTIANDAVTFAKLQNINTASFIGRITAASGDAEILSVLQAQTLLGLGTAALLNTGLASGNIPLLGAGGILDPAVVPRSVVTSIQTVADQAARLALLNAPDGSVISVGDCVKQSDNGVTFMLAALPATTNGNWISIGDTAIDASDIQSGIISTVRLGSGTANNTTFLRGDNTWAAPAAGGNTPYVTVASTAQAMAVNTGYLANNASKVTLTLPAVAAVGDRVLIFGIALGGWLIAQNAGQTIRYLNRVTTTGVSGKIDTQLPSVGVVDPFGTIELVCVTANTVWQVKDATGTVDIV